MFPTMLVRRIIECFTRAEGRRILDPFCGSGSTLVAARELDGHGIGFEVSPQYVDLANRRMALLGAEAGRDYDLHPASATAIREVLPAQSVDLCVPSPPYWDILAQKRSADYKEIRDYAGADGDLSRLHDYPEFVEALARIFDGVFEVLKPGAYCV